MSTIKLFRCHNCDTGITGDNFVADVICGEWCEEHEEHADVIHINLCRDCYDALLLYRRTLSPLHPYVGMEFNVEDWAD